MSRVRKLRRALLRWTGIWTTCWLFFLILTAVCTVWLHLVVRNVLKQQSPEQLHRIEFHPGDQPDATVQQP